MATADDAPTDATAAIMQPYLFPYLGYYQLISASDTFVFLDDVAFMKRGWINRNRILVAGNAFLFTVPVRAASQNRSIRETEIAEVGAWRRRLERTLRHAYANAPFLAETLDLVHAVISRSTSSIAELAAESVRAVCAHLELPASFRSSSELDTDDTTGAERIIALCQACGATRYVNPPGGTELYDRSQFARAGIDLKFLRPHLPEYSQRADPFVPGLSIIDVLMCNPRETVRTWAQTFDLE